MAARHARATTVNLALAALDSFHQFRGVDRPSVRPAARGVAGPRSGVSHGSQPFQLTVPEPGSIVQFAADAPPNFDA